MLVLLLLVAVPPGYEVWVDTSTGRRFPAAILSVDNEYVHLMKPDQRRRSVRLRHLNTGSLLQVVRWYQRKDKPQQTLVEKPRPVQQRSPYS